MATKESSKDTRPSAHARGYDRAWRRIRRKKLRHDPLCEHCEQQSRVKAAVEVDHIIPIDERPDLRLDWDNLQSLCKPCHSSKTHSKAPGVALDGYPVSQKKGGAG